MSLPRTHLDHLSHDLISSHLISSHLSHRSHRARSPRAFDGMCVWPWRSAYVWRSVRAIERVNVYECFDRQVSSLDRSQQPSPQLANACFPLSPSIHLSICQTKQRQLDRPRPNEGTHQNKTTISKDGPNSTQQKQNNQQQQVSERVTDRGRERFRSVCHRERRKKDRESVKLERKCVSSARVCVINQAIRPSGSQASRSGHRSGGSPHSWRCAGR